MNRMHRNFRNNIFLDQNYEPMQTMPNMDYNVNNIFMNNLNDYNYPDVHKSNCKTIHLFYEGQFIQNVDIYNFEDYISMRNKIKSILYNNGKISYRKALENETIEREYPFETLETLIDRGVIDKEPRIVFTNKRTFQKYYNYFKYDEINDGDTLDIKYDDKLLGSGGLGGSFDFVNIDKLTKPTNLYFSKYAPKWRNVSVGLNLFGKCINSRCRAYNQEVIFVVGINEKFDFNRDKKTIKCPMCSKNFMPNTVGFWKCEYQIKGEKLEDGEYQEIDISGRETKGDNFEYFDPYNDRQICCWTRLVIFAAHRQKMKFRKYTI